MSTSLDPIRTPEGAQGERATGFVAVVIDLLIQHRNLFLIVGLLFAGLAVVPASHLTLNQSIESLYAPDNPQLKSFQESKSLFGGDDFVMVAWKQKDIFKIRVLKEIHQFAAQLSAVEGIEGESTQSIAKVFAPPDSTILYRFSLKMPSIRKPLVKFSEGVLIGKDGETTVVLLRLQSREGQTVSRAKTIADIRALADAHSPPAYVVGESVQVHDMFRIVEEDGVMLGAFSTGILLFLIMVLFRSIRWMILPLLVVHFSLIETKAILVLLGFQLSMVSSMLNSLVTIIGIATVMHITILFRNFRKLNSREEAIRKTFYQLAAPVFWTCVTTSIGFAALLSSGIQPVRSFGLMMTMGTMFVFLNTAILVPGCVLLGSYQPDPSETPFEHRWDQFLDRVACSVTRFPGIWLSVSAIALLFSIVGFQFLQIETDFSRNFRSESPIVKSLNFVESNLGGAGSWEVSFDAPENLDEDYLKELRACVNELRELKVQQEGFEAAVESRSLITKVVCLTDGFNLIPNRYARSIEDKQAVLQKYQSEFEPSLYAPENKRMRIVLRALERQPSEAKLALIQQVEQVVEKRFENVSTTGLFVLLANLIQSLLGDQVMSFVIAAIGIGVMMTIAFRNFRIGLVSLIPNIFPIVILIGMMGWLDIAVNIGTAMIASVSLGLTVDSSIHYLSSFMRLRREGLTTHEAVHETHRLVGKTLILANLTLICGFLVLTLSNFLPLVYFGLLVSIAMLGGLFGNLVLLPILLRLGSSERKCLSNSN